MNHRTLGKTNYNISEISLGTWQVGGKWGTPFDHDLADKILNTAVDQGVNFIDTADVYGGGESEKAIGRLVRNRSERIYVATKCGRQLNPHTSEAYQPAALRQFVEDSLRNMQLDTLDLMQLHCPPTDVYYRPEIFGLFDRLKEEGKIQHLGVSVERVEEGLKAIAYPNISAVQIIFNMFRHRPSELFFREAKAKNMGIIVRVPLASGLLTGKFTENSEFLEGDHRHFNREGEAFDKGETFSGVDYETGLKAVAALEERFPSKSPLAQLALRWVLMFDGVSTVIPGASRPEQIQSNVAVSALPPLTVEEMAEVRKVYHEYIAPQVHQRW